MDLTKYNISDNGFLPKEPLKNLPTYFEEWNNIIYNLPITNKNKTTRNIVNNMSLLDYCKLSTYEELCKAYSILTLITNSYVWQNEQNNQYIIIPKNLAIPLWNISQKLGISPLLTHATVDLYNWQLKDYNKPPELDNLEIIYTITNTQDEKWFYSIMTAIEYEGHNIIKLIPLLQNLNSVEEICGILDIIKQTIDKICLILKRIREKCNPNIFYNVLRPYLAGWEHGAIYEGINEKPIKYIGGSAAQSSLFPLIDYIFNIKHENDYFNTIKNYMPIKHKDFLEYINKHIKLFDYIKQNNDNSELILKYNNCIYSLIKFRKIHFGIINSYIISFITSDNPKGTGGTMLNTFFKKTIEETKFALFK